MWNIYNGIAHYGVFHHFIHPDDILDPGRSLGRKWVQLEREFLTLIESVEEHAYYLESMTVYEGYRNLKNRENAKVYSYQIDDTIHIQYDQYALPMHHYLKLRDQSVTEVKGGEFEIIDQAQGLYYIKGESEHVEIRLVSR